VEGRDACALLAQDDVEELFGGRARRLLSGRAPAQTGARAAASPAAAAPGRKWRSEGPGTGPIATRCGYASESTTPLKVVGLLVEQFPDHAAAASAYDRARGVSGAIAGMPPEDLPGLGDRAYWAGGTLKQLNVLKDNLWLNLNITVGPGLDQEAPARQAVQRVLKRL
jgi:hypothetical protein